MTFFYLKFLVAERKLVGTCTVPDVYVKQVKAVLGISNKYVTAC